MANVLKKNGIRRKQGVVKKTSSSIISPEEEHIKYIFQRNLSGDFIGNETDDPDPEEHRKALQTPIPESWTACYDNGMSVRWYYIYAGSFIAKFRLHFEDCQSWELLGILDRNNKSEDEESDDDDDEQDGYYVPSKPSFCTSEYLPNPADWKPGEAVLSIYERPKFQPLTDQKEIETAKQTFAWLDQFLLAHISPRWKAHTRYPVSGFDYYGVEFCKPKQ